HPAAGSRFSAAILQGQRQTSCRCYARSHERLTDVQLAGQCSRAAHRHRTRRRDGDRTENHAARSAIRAPSGRGRHSSQRHFAGESFRRKSKPPRSPRNRAQIDFASFGDYEWKRYCGRKETRHQPANTSPKNQRIERREESHRQRRADIKCRVAKNLFKLRSTRSKQAELRSGSSAARLLSVLSPLPPFICTNSAAFRPRREWIR